MDHGYLRCRFQVHTTFGIVLLGLGKVMELRVWWPDSGPSPLQEREQEERRKREAFANLRAAGVDPYFTPKHI
jgi:hypothetical protein